METDACAGHDQRYIPAIPVPKAPLTALQQYYETAGPDYISWSRNFNMHFGYYCRFTDLFSLEKMLVNMNDEVLKELSIDPEKRSVIADLGCGMGTVARHIAKKLPLSHLSAITIVDYQVQNGIRLNLKHGFADRIDMIKDDFEKLHFPSGSFSHAYALESACHASGDKKQKFIAELARVLENGGRFCIADGFLKNRNRKPRLFNWLYKRIARYWAVPGFADIHEFEQALSEHGLKHIKVREISYRIAPSVLYVPLVCVKFFFKEIWKNKSLRMKKERWHNVYAPLLGMFMGLYRKHFGYFMITGTKE